MSEEIVSQVSPKTFNLVGLLSGRDYPTETVDVYFDEILGTSIYSLSQLLPLLIASGNDEGVATVQKELDELVEKTKSARYKVTIQAVSEDVRRAIHDKVEAKHPTKLNFMGQPEPNPKSDRLFQKLLWETYIRTVEDSEGRVSTVGEAEVQALMDKAPAPAQNAINEGIRNLQKSAQEGYEFAAKEIDFLSKA